MEPLKTERLVLILTSLCDAQCPQCLRAKDGKSIELETVKKIILEAKGLGCNMLNLSGGELWLYPHFNELMDFITDQEMDFTVVSNAKRYEKYAPLLKHKKKFRWITFSLDGMKEKHDQSRGTGSFDQVLSAFRFFSDHIPTHLNICLSRVNLNELESMVEVAHGAGCQLTRALGVISDKKTDPFVLNQEERQGVVKRVNAIQKKNNLKISALSSILENRNDNFCSALKNFRNNIAITPKGQATFCCDMTGNGFFLGDLKKESLRKIIDRAEEMAFFLKEKRAECLASNHPIIQESLCHFCNYAIGKFKL
jgi:MoaA/NifB/PqqE/SkfB family radical SAM enzyme